MTSPGFASSKAIARVHLLQPHLEEDFPLARIAAECGVAERTLRRWLAAWRANGIEGLERARRSDAGNRRMLDPDLEGLVRSMATKRPRPTAAAIHRKIQAEAKARGIAGISYSVVASIVRGVEAVDDRHCRCGRKKRGAARIEIPRPGAMATIERIPPPEPRCDPGLPRLAFETERHRQRRKLCP